MSDTWVWCAIYYFWHQIRNFFFVKTYRDIYLLPGQIHDWEGESTKWRGEEGEGAEGDRERRRWKVSDRMATFLGARVSVIVCRSSCLIVGWTPPCSSRSAISWWQENQRCFKPWSPLVGLPLKRHLQPPSVNRSRSSGEFWRTL